MFSNFKYGTPQNEIGEVVSVLAGNNATEILSNTQGKFVLTDRIYNRADYPELYARIGSVGASQFTPRTSGTTSTLNVITYGNGIYLTGGVGGALRSSTDGITWSTVTSPTTGNINALLYGNGLYVMLDDASSGTIRSSTDSITWTTRKGVVGTSMVSGSYSEGIFILGGVVGGVPTVEISSNGISWTTRTLGAAFSLTVTEVLYANGRYLAFGGNGTSKTSTDGITWTNVISGPTGGNGIRSLGYGNGLYLCSEQGGILYTSTDSVTWTSISGVGTFETITYNNGLFFAGQASGGMRTSSDGTNWTTRASGTTSTILGSTYGNGRYVYVGNGGVLGTSNTAIVPEYATTYDASTQFYVPAYTTGSRFYTLPTYGSNSAPRFVNYVRAK